MDTNIFEAASRSKLRFTYMGLISVEDLWDLSLQQLDSIYKALKAKARVAKEESLLTIHTKKDDELALQIEIVEHVFKVKMEEMDAQLKLADRKIQKQKLLAILAEKQDGDLKSKSQEELLKMVEDLG